MDQEQANRLIGQILANYPYPVDGVKISAYSAQIIEFDYGEASEVLLKYCRTKPKPGEPPSSFELRKAIRDAQYAKRNGQKKIVPPQMEEEDFKKKKDELLRKTGLLYGERKRDDTN